MLLFSTLCIYFVIGDLDGILEPVAIYFTMLLFSTLGIDFVIGDVDGKLEPVGIEVNSHDCTINCQLFEFMNPHTQGNAVKPYVETMIARSQKFSMQGRTVLVIGAGGYSKCFIWDTYQTFGIQVHKLPSTLPEYLQIFRFHFYFKINEKHNIPHCWNSSLIQSKNIRNRIKLITHDHSMS